MLELADRVSRWLEALTEYPDRHVGGEGNRAATALFAHEAEAAGLHVSRIEFDCLEWEHGTATLTADGGAFSLEVGPYSPPARLSAPLVAASSVEELESESTRGAVVLLHGDIAAHQLMPRNFVFYNPESHKRVYRAIDRLEPAAVLAATGTDPEMVGGQYPFPLFEDGDLGFPSAYLKDVDGERLLAYAGRSVELAIESERIPTRAEQVIAVKRGRSGVGRPGRVVVFAHIDSRKGSPGGLDNASGTCVLLALLTELLSDYSGGLSVEIVPINGEDNYAAPGEMIWLAENEGCFGDIVLGVNVDDAGMRDRDTHVSFYGCPETMHEALLEVVRRRPQFAEGPQWYQSDHAIFGMHGIPAVAVATEGMYDFMAEFAHTSRDTAQLADPHKIAAIARFVRDAIDVANEFGD